MTRRINRRAEANLLWYIIYLGAAMLLLGTITYLGVNTFTVHSTTDDLRREFIFERAPSMIHEPNPYTGTRDTLAPDLAGRLSQLHQNDRSFAMRVQITNKTYHTDKDTFDTMLSRVGTDNALRRMKVDKDGHTTDITVVIER